MTRILTNTDALIRALVCNWDIDWRGQTSASAGGVDQIVYNAFPRWIGTPKIDLRNVQIAAYRAVRAHGQGRAGVWRVPLVDEDGRGPRPGGTTWGGGVTWDGGVSWAVEPTVVCAVAAAAGASEIVVTEGGETVTVGQFISHDDWPYVVTWRSEESDGVHLGVEMPLRRPIPQGAEIHLRARGLFRLASDMSGNPAYDRRFVAQPELQFIEWLGPERFA